MLHGIYFRFYRITHSQWISAVLAHLAYGVIFLRYLAARMVRRHRKISLTEDEALTLIKKVHPDRGLPSPFQPEALDEDLDLSILVPVYNRVGIIEQTIHAILAQKTKYHFQLVLVDDGSMDGTREILKKYMEHPKVRVIFQENQEIAGARNTALNAATGKYIMFVDSDDTVNDDLVDTLMKKAYQDDCDIVMCAHNLVKERNGKVYETLPNIYPQFDMLGYAKNAKILNYAGLPWGKVYKREIWDNIRFMRGYWYEDSIIHALVFMRCKRFAYIPKVCYQYRRNEDNYSHIQSNHSNPRQIDSYWLMAAILRKHQSLQLPRDDRFETMLLKHLSAYYCTNTFGFDRGGVQDALFILACALYEKYGVKEKCRLPYMLRVTRKALRNRDIELWKIAAKYQK